VLVLNVVILNIDHFQFFTGSCPNCCNILVLNIDDLFSVNVNSNINDSMSIMLLFTNIKISRENNNNYSNNNNNTNIKFYRSRIFSNLSL